MVLPTPPPYTTPIPNSPFYSLPSYLLQGAYSPYVVGAGLFVDPSGTISATGGGGGVATITGGSGIGVSSPTGNVTLTNTGVTSLIAGSGITLSGNTGNITISASGTGTVTSVGTGTGLTGGPITTSGVISLANSGVTPNTYTNSTITVDATGRITAASSGTVVSSVVGTAPITVSTAAGTATVGITAATTAACGAVLLSDSTSSTSSATAATSLALKTAFDAAVAAIPKACVAAKGTLVTATSPSVPFALPVGSDGQVLVADSTCSSGLTWRSISAPGATPTTLGTVFGCTTNTAAANVLLGNKAGCALGGDVRNTAIGVCSLSGATSGPDNTALGACSAQGITIGACNTVVGSRAGSALTTGSYNVVLGAGVTGAAASCCLFIGYCVSGGPSVNWITGAPSGEVQFAAGIVDCAGSCGTANQVLTSQGNAIEWKEVNSALAVPNYGSFIDTTTQSVGLVNTPQAVTLNTTVASTNFSIVSGSQVTAAVAGTYNLQFSIQLETTTASLSNVEIWLAKNGTAVPDSNTRFVTKGSGEAAFAALNYVETLAVGDYLELIWASDDANMQMITAPSLFSGPQIPSVILTIVPVGA